jgi:hypothetical protein
MPKVKNYGCRASNPARKRDNSFRREIWSCTDHLGNSGYAEITNNNLTWCNLEQLEILDTLLRVDFIDIYYDIERFMENSERIQVTVEEV